MKERVKVMQDVYENRSTNKKAAGCTVKPLHSTLSIGYSSFHDWHFLR